MVGYIGFGAVVGAATGGIVSGLSSVMAGGAFGAGFMGSAAACSVSSSFLSGAALGAIGGYTGGATLGFGYSILEGNNIGVALKSGYKGGLIGGASGAVLGGLSGGLDAAIHDRNFWDGSYNENLFIGSTTKGDVITNYDNGNEVISNDIILNERFDSEINARVGEYKIKEITTKSGDYGYLTNGLYVDNDGSMIAGYVHYSPSGYSNIHVSLAYLNADKVDFMAVAGHEFVHAYLHYQYPNILRIFRKESLTNILMMFT